MWLLFGIREFYSEPAPGGKSYKKWRIEPEDIPVAKKYFFEYEPTPYLRYSFYFEMRDKKLVLVKPHILENEKELRSLIERHQALDNATRKDYLAFLDKTEAAGPGKLVEHIFIVAGQGGPKNEADGN